MLGAAVLFFRRNAYAFPLAAYPVVFPLLYYVTHTSLRYRHPIDPIALLLTAVAAKASMSFFPSAGASKNPTSASQPHKFQDCLCAAFQIVC
jgi:hypothetical protein